MSALPAFDALLKERGIAGRAATHSATLPVLGFFANDKPSLGRESIPYSEAVFSYIQHHRISEVVLIARWTGYANIISKDADPVPLDSALLITVQRLVHEGVRAWILLQWPVHTFDIPKALVRSVIFREDLGALCAKPGPSNGLDGNDNEVVRKIEAAGGRVLDPRPRFLSSDRGHYVILADGTALYRDGGHLTTDGAILMLLPLLRESFDVAPLMAPALQDEVRPSPVRH